MTGGKFKKKRSFLQTAKKFGRLGQRGRGANIAQVPIDYIIYITLPVINLFRRLQINVSQLVDHNKCTTMIYCTRPMSVTWIIMIQSNVSHLKDY